MKDYRKFSYAFLLVMLLFVAFHFCVWHLGNNKKLLAPKVGCMVGDLARISYCPDCANTRPIRDPQLLSKHFEYAGRYQKSDLITFGDSFSAGGGGGKNPYYQDYIALYNNLDVMNIPNAHDPVETLVEFIDNGKIDELKPKYVVLQSVGRLVTARLSKELNFKQAELKKSVEPNKTSKSKKEIVSKTSEKKTVVANHLTPMVMFLNTGNYKFVIYNLLYNFNQRAFVATAHRMLIDRQIEGHDFVLVHRRDIKALRDIDEIHISKVNENLNKISEKLESKGIKFYFMITPDKYDLYQDFFTKSYGRNNLFDLMRKQDKKYSFIDTKKILSKEIAKGNYDVYHFDDTHWTYKAPEAIFKVFKFE